MNPSAFRTPAVRHLAWLCGAPQLITSAVEFDPGNYLPAGVSDRLVAWDRRPDSGPDVLTEPPARRLGHYFERLYETMLRDLLGWEILLKNQPVRRNGITLGELDFIVHNLADDTVEHHEIAVKFYLGFADGGTGESRWYGPNARDRLDLKSQRLIHHQSQLTMKSETRHLLESFGITDAIRPRTFMPGYLFYPHDNPMSAPPGPARGHLQGHWIYADELACGDSRDSLNTDFWIPLNKPHWLGPWQQTVRPSATERDEALDMVRSRGIPRLFAELELSPERGTWHEARRVFVVPRSWPG